MYEQWYYIHNGKKIGPISVLELISRAVRDLVGPLDLIWPEGVDAGLAVKAAAARDLARILAQPTPPSATVRLTPPSTPPAPLPRALQSEPGDAARTPAANAPAGSGPTPNWLQDVVRLEQQAIARGGARGPAPQRVDTAPTRPPVPPPTPSTATSARPPADAAPTPERPAGPPATTDSSLPDRDPLTAEELEEFFSRGQAILEDWANRKQSRPLILAGDLEAIKHDKQVQYILRSFRQCGPDLVNKLWRHLVLLVEKQKRSEPPPAR